MAMACCISYAQSESEQKDVVIIEDSIIVTNDTILPKELAIDSVQPIDTLQATTICNLDSTEQATKKDSILTVVKGYSPFTNYTDTFYVEINKDEAITNKPTTDNKRDSAKILRRLAKYDSTNNKFISDYEFAYTKTSLMKAWKSYANQEPAVESHQTESNKTTEKTFENHTNNKTNQTLLAANQAPLVKDNDGISTNNDIRISDDISTNTDATSVEFYIQLAASRKPLTDTELKQLTNQQESVRSITEDSWHKYQLPVGADYLKAREAINSYPNKNTFLVAYKGIEKLSLWETVKHIELQKPKEPELLFVIQLAASREPLSIEEKEKLNSGSDHIRVIEEEGWFKYQVVVGPSYTLAIEKWKLIGTTRSFPVAYLDGSKIDMAEAIKK